MKVKDLIKELGKLKPNCEIKISPTSNTCYEIETINLNLFTDEAYIEINIAPRKLED
jgi:hypothetical protein